MIETIKFWFIDQHPVIQALIAGLFTWIVTAIGSGLVFFFNLYDEQRSKIFTKNFILFSFFMLLAIFSHPFSIIFINKWII